MSFQKQPRNILSDLDKKYLATNDNALAMWSAKIDLLRMDIGEYYRMPVCSMDIDMLLAQLNDAETMYLQGKDFLKNINQYIANINCINAIIL